MVEPLRTSLATGDQCVSFTSKTSRHERRRFGASANSRVGLTERVNDFETPTVFI